MAGNEHCTQSPTTCIAELGNINYRDSLPHVIRTICSYGMSCERAKTKTSVSGLLITIVSYKRLPWAAWRISWVSASLWSQSKPGMCDIVVVPSVTWIWWQFGPCLRTRTICKWTDSVVTQDHHCMFQFEILFFFSQKAAICNRKNLSCTIKSTTSTTMKLTMITILFEHLDRAYSHASCHNSNRGLCYILFY